MYVYPFLPVVGALVHAVVPRRLGTHGACCPSTRRVSQSELSERAYEPRGAYAHYTSQCTCLHPVICTIWWPLPCMHIKPARLHATQAASGRLKQTRVGSPRPLAYATISICCMMHTRVSIGKCRHDVLEDLCVAYYVQSQRHRGSWHI